MKICLNGGEGGLVFMENRFAKYIELAKNYKMVNAQIITPDDIVFDIRAILKCRWGCNDFFKEDVRCHNRNTNLRERMEMIKKYRSILLLHSHNARDISIAALKIEREAFRDGYYFAFAMRFCNFCENCSVESTGVCQFPEKVRPCDQSFGMDIFATARKLGLPCEVLGGHEEIQNRFGLVLLD